MFQVAAGYAAFAVPVCQRYFSPSQLELTTSSIYCRMGLSESPRAGGQLVEVQPPQPRVVSQFGR